MDYLDILKSEYEIIRPLSRGGHGECYLVRRGDFFATAKVYFKNAERECAHEAEIYKALHGNLAKEDFFQASRLNDAPILIMQTYEGDTLEEFFASPAYREKTLPKKLDLLIRVCKTVSAMHKAGILHLDIKPSNFFISENENAIKPIDMGSAILINRKYNDFDDLSSASGYHSTCGFGSCRLLTLDSYLAFDAEELDEKRKQRALELEAGISAKDDVYSLICLIYNALIEGVLSDIHDGFLSPREMLFKKLTECKIPDYLIPPLCDLFMSALNEDVPFNSVDELISTLHRFLNIENNCGCDPIVFLRNAKEKFSLPADFDKNLLCSIEGIGNIADYYKNSPSRLTHLVCAGGAGKTYQLHNLEKDLFESGDFIPLYIPLNSYDNGHTYIREYIAQRFAGRGAEPNMVSYALSDSKVLLLIDGINETSYSPARLYREIEELSKISGLYILVSDRGDNMPLDGFTRISLSPLDDAYLIAQIDGFSKLDADIKELLGLPFYFTHYTAIPEDERGDIKGASSLLEKYFERLINRAKNSSDGDDYRYLAKVIIREFLPLFSYIQSTQTRRLSFNAKDCSSLWRNFRDEHDIVFDKRCVQVLIDLGIVKMQGEDIYAFSHQNIFTYFAAKFLCEKGSDNYIKAVYDENILKMLGEMWGDLIFKRLSRHKGDFSGASAEIVSKYVQILKLCGKNQGADFANLDLRCVNLVGGSWEGCDFSGSIFDNFFVTAPELSGEIKLCYTDGKVVVASDLKSRVLIFDLNLSIKAILSPKYYWASAVKITDDCIYLIDTYRNDAYIHALSLSDFSQSISKCSPAASAEFAENLVKTEQKACGFKAWSYKNHLIVQDDNGEYVRKINLNMRAPLTLSRVSFDGEFLRAGEKIYDVNRACFVKSEHRPICPKSDEIEIDETCVFIGGKKIQLPGKPLLGGASVFGDTAHILYFDDGLYLLKYNLKTGASEVFDTDIDLCPGEPDFCNLKAALSESCSAVYYNNILHFYLHDINWTFSEFTLLPPLNMDIVRGMKFCGDELIILHDDDMISGVSLTLPEVAPPDGSRGVSYRADDDISYIHAYSLLYSYEISLGDIVGAEVDDDVFEVHSKEPVAKIKRDFTLTVLRDTNLSRCDFTDCKMGNTDIPDEILFNV